MVEKLVKQVGPKNGPNLQFVGFFEAAKYGTQAAKLFSWVIKADILQRAVMRMVIRMIDDDVCGSPSAPLQ